MDRFFVDKKNINIENNTCIIEGEDVKHISKVLRCRIGEELEVCDNNNNEYTDNPTKTETNNLIISLYINLFTKIIANPIIILKKTI